MTVQLDRTRVASIIDDDLAMNDSCRDIINAVDQLPEIEVPIGVLLPSLYLRESGTSHAHVQLLADAAESSALPPILVQQCSHRVIDGMHRLAAAKLRGERSIKARFVDCADEEALFLAIKSNTLHGLPLSRGDRISGAKRILASHPDWSDRAVASVAGISARTVAVLRNRSADNIRSFEKRLGRDGKRRPVTGTDGRRRAAEYINTHPGASLRQVARETDVSLGTVHNVLQLIRSGIDPVATPPESPAEQAAARSSADATPKRPLLTSITSTRSAKDARQLSWASIQSKLVNDPSLRYTEGGRAFLRWMALHAMQAEQWREFVEAIPARWVADISVIADNMAIEWQMYAERLRGRDLSAS
jgi:ParB-like chromosome segregation protein Spo0J